MYEHFSKIETKMYIDEDKVEKMQQKISSPILLFNKRGFSPILC